MTSSSQQAGWNDVILVASLLYACCDLWLVWDDFHSCSQPIHHWLIVVYVSILGFRLMNITGTALAESSGAAGLAGAASDNFLLTLRGKDTIPWALTLLTWCVAVPFFTAWTMVGTIWLRSVATHTPHCMPMFYGWLSCFWFAMSWLWIFVHLAMGVRTCRIEWRVRKAANELRAIEDDDVHSRWGNVSSFAEHMQCITGRGLLAEEIQELPEFTFALPSNSADLVSWRPAHLRQHSNCRRESGECSICICDFKPGDRVRRLPTCEHLFHRSCIDLWLLRRAKCPLCKSDVRGAITGHV